MTQIIFLFAILFLAWGLLIFKKPISRYFKDHENVSKYLAILCVVALIAMIIFSLWAIFI
jgi:hypothetical protein